MTHITDKFPTKKAFKEAVKVDAKAVYVTDPSIIGAVSGSVEYVATTLEYFTVTNHPKRSWYAAIEFRDGVITVD